MKSSHLFTDLAAINDGDFMAADTLALANSLYHDGDLAEARKILRREVSDRTGDEKLSAAVTLAKVEWADKRYVEALRLLTEHAPLAAVSQNHALIWRFHHVLGGTYQLLASPENDYADRALVEYAGVVRHQELAGDGEQAGLTLGNVALIQAGHGRFGEARRHLARARELLRSPVSLAEMDDTDAQIRLKEGKDFEALCLSIKACGVFCQYGERLLLEEAKRTLMLAMARDTAAHGVDTRRVAPVGDVALLAL